MKPDTTTSEKWPGLDAARSAVAACFTGVPWQQVLADLQGLQNTGTWPDGVPAWATAVAAAPQTHMVAVVAEHEGMRHIINQLVAERTR